MHPIDGDLRFLKRLIRQLEEGLGSNLRYLRLSNNYRSHRDSLLYINNAPVQSNIFFFCHGRSDGVIGCRHLELYSTHHNRYAHREHEDDACRMLHEDNFHYLDGKKVFCLACNSNGFAKKVLDSGARVFVGFDSVDFDKRELLENNKWSRYVIDITKYNFRKCLCTAILSTYRDDLSYNHLVARLKLLINKTNDRLAIGMRGHKGYKYYDRASKNLQLIKEGIKVWGDGSLGFND